MVKTEIGKRARVRFGRRALLAAVLLAPLLIAGAQETSREPAEPAEPSFRPAVPADPQAFEGYWSRGLAEITSYSLEQSRYGEVHPGQAVLIFVTEDFSRSRQVKLDQPERAGEDRARVLKLNFTKKFSTGIYPYSLMASVFTPLDGSGTLKLTASAQEWCGQVFSQLNRRGEGLEIAVRSYFESEGDMNVTLADLELEDDVWTRLRLDPSTLHTGVLEILPPLLYLRLAHRPLKAYSAEATLLPPGPDGLARYRLDYPELERQLEIRYRPAFPYEVEGWEETYPEGRGGKALTTRATRKERTMLDYWKHNHLEDAPLRQQLGID